MPVHDLGPWEYLGGFTGSNILKMNSLLLKNINCRKTWPNSIQNPQNLFPFFTLAQAKWKRNNLQWLAKMRTSPCGKCLRSEGSPLQVVGPTTQKERICMQCRRAGEWYHQVTIDRGQQPEQEATSQQVRESPAR